MVTKSDYITWINNPFSIKEKEMEALENLMEEYPYCQSIASLLTKAYHSHENILFEPQLKKTAISVPDRSQLYALIHTEKPIELKSQTVTVIKNEEIAEETKVSQSDELELTKKEKAAATSLSQNLETTVIEKKELLKDKDSQELEKLILSSAMGAVPLLEEEENIEDEKQESAKSEKTPPKNKKVSPQSFFDWLAPDSIENIEKVDESKANTNIEELVDRFILERKNNSGHIRISNTENENKFYSPIKVASQSLIEKDEFATETLAKIYLNQGLTDKAITIYERLSLKNPEKNSYFADLIQKIRKNEQ